MLRPDPDAISNNAKNTLVVRRSAAIGDSIAASVVADRLIDLGYSIHWQCHDLIKPAMVRHPRLQTVSHPGGFCHVDLDQSYERDIHRRLKHFHKMFFEAAQRQLGPMGIDIGEPWNAKPTLLPLANGIAAFRDRFKEYPRPWVFICPRSETYNVRQVPDGIWSEAAKRINGTCFWLGLHPAMAPIVDLGCRQIDYVMALIGAADVVCSVDTGPMHIAAAMGIPLVAIGQSSSPELHLSDKCDFVTISPKLDCLNCQENVCKFNASLPLCQSIDPQFIADWVNARAGSIFGHGVSALIPTYRATTERLNRCVEAVLPQVDEVIITMAQDALLPDRAPQGPKIRYVRKPVPGLGFGKNCNFGFRHTNSPWVLLLNDDVYLDEHAIAELKKLRGPNIGAIAHLLRYPNGQIQYGGKYRENGGRGWGHIDHKAWDPKIREPVEQEVLCGASVLVNRRAFYKVGGFDERFTMYSEDDDLSMMLRQAGYRLLWTPHARGIHEDSATSRHTGKQLDWINQSNALMGQKWAWYWDKNRNNNMGTFD